MVKHTHLGSYGLITKDNNILLIKKGRGPFTGLYDLPGGKIEFGENPKEALYREINEEVGLESKCTNLLDVLSKNVIWTNYENNKEKLHHIGIIYDVMLMEAEEHIKDVPDGQDSLGAKWINLNEVNLAQLTPFAKLIINNLQNNI